MAAFRAVGASKPGVELAVPPELTLERNNYVKMFNFLF